jgi:hypothetical protein
VASAIGPGFTPQNSLKESAWPLPCESESGVLLTRSDAQRTRSPAVIADRW